MAMTPNSVVHLLNVPLESDNKNQIYFSDKTSQKNYFLSKKVHTFDNLTYQRKDNYIRVPLHIDELYNCNYVMYQNTNYTNRWFYAFITKMEYISDGTTYVYIETDVYQTWLFDVTIKKSFVEREHVMDDTPGLHTIPEGLETGEYIRQVFNSNSGEDYMSDFYFLSSYYIVVAMSHLTNDMVGALPTNAREYNGVYSGLTYLVFKTAKEVDDFIKDIQDNITEDVIQSVFIIPLKMCDIPEDDWITRKTYSFAYYPYTKNEVRLGGCGITKPEYLDKNYVPKNKKLLTFPYTYILANNYGGSTKEYRYEYFGNDVMFEVLGAISPGCAIKLFPVGYNVTNKDEDIEHTINTMEGLDCYKLPTCSWNNDTYTNWLTQNAVNQPLQMGLGIGSTIVGVATLNPVVAGGGLLAITNVLTEKYEKSLAPITAKGGVNQGDLNFARRNTFGIYKMSIRKEYAIQIDNYFEMFGYKVNTVKIPNLNDRPHWNYVKTIDINIDGAIPNEDMTKLKSIYDNGVTLWKNGDNLGNYSLNNH